MAASFAHPSKQEALARFADFLSRRFGLNFPQERWTDLHRAVTSLNQEWGYKDDTVLVERILAGYLTPEEEEQLLSHLTIGETYFFRDEALFKIIGEQILPQLIEARRSGPRVLRLWSAGCCSGEEPYSLAIQLHKLLSDLKNWHITILGTDLNPAFLRKAAAGVYREWSFRNTPPGLKEKYFSKKEDHSYEIIPAVKRMVRFSHLNLAAGEYPSESNDIRDFDIIICRNVLMYLTKETATAVIERFHKCLVEGGWLVTSPYESFPQPPLFQPINWGGTIIYRRGDYPSTPGDKQPFSQEKPGPSPVPDLSPLPTTPFVTRRRTAVRRDDLPAPRGKEAGRQPIPSSKEASAKEPLETARFWANQGRYDEAIKWCRQAIEKERLNPDGYYLLAQVWEAAEKHPEAIEALKKTLYLNQDHVMAHFRLGLLLQGQGKIKESQRHLKSARSLLAKYPADGMVKDADGLTAGRLLKMLEVSLGQG